MDYPILFICHNLCVQLLLFSFLTNYRKISATNVVHEKTNISSSVDGELQLDTPFVGFFLEIRVVELEDELRLVESAVLLLEHHVHLVHVRCVFSLNGKILYLEIIHSLSFTHKICFMDPISCDTVKKEEMR